MEWLTTVQAAERMKRPVKYVREIAESGELHGHQRMRNGQPVRKSRWSFAATAVDAYIQGHDDRAQRTACGCPSLRAVASAGRRTG